MATTDQAPSNPPARVMDPPFSQQGRGVASSNLFGYPLVTKKVALTLGEALLRERWGDGKAAEQIPLHADDGGTEWRVLGRHNVDDAQGQFCVLIRKTDAHIADIGIFHGPGKGPSQSVDMGTFEGPLSGSP